MSFEPFPLAGLKSLHLTEASHHLFGICKARLDIRWELIRTTRYFCDLARFDRLEDCETRGHVRQQLVQGN